MFRRAEPTDPRPPCDKLGMVNVVRGAAEPSATTRLALTAAVGRSVLPVQTFYKTAEWRRWKGSPEDLGEAGRLAAEVLAEWSEKTVSFDMRIEMRVGESLHIDELSDLDVLKTIEAPSVRAVSVAVRAPGLRPYVWIKTATDGSALKVQVIGTDQPLVLGLAERLRKELDSGGRSPRWYRRDQLLLALLLFPIGVLVAFGLRPQIGGAAADVIPFGFLAITVLSGIVFLATPSLEMLDRGSKTRLDRLWRPIVAFLVAIITGLLGSALWTAIT